MAFLAPGPVGIDGGRDVSDLMFVAQGMEYENGWR